MRMTGVRPEVGAPLVWWGGGSLGCRVDRKCRQGGPVGVEHSIAQHTTAQHNTAQHNIQHSTTHYSTTLHITAPTAAQEPPSLPPPFHSLPPFTLSSPCLCG